MLHLTELTERLRSRDLTSRDLVDAALARIEASGREGPLIFRALDAERARETAEHVDRARAGGAALPPFAGIPVTVKDLFDMAGEVTRAGSRVLDDAAPAARDAPAVALLRRAGFIVIGRTNMTEFAYSGLGVNAHFGTPANPAAPGEIRIPGGSSSGAAVSVAAGMAPAALGTDTGGSCRIPAAFCGIVGFKPSSTRISRAGTVPLSRSLDSVGPLAGSVSCCARLDSVLSGGRGEDAAPAPAPGLRLGVVGNYVAEALDDAVGEAFGATLNRLRGAGVEIIPVSIPEFDEMPTLNAMGGIVGAEAFAWHRELLETHGGLYDPFVRARLEASRGMPAADYILLLEERERVRAQVAARMAGLDALAMPTVQILAPRLADLDTAERATQVNRLCLRNTSLANFLDVPAISIPCQDTGALPVGFMLMGRTGEDRKLLSVAAGLEALIRKPQRTLGRSLPSHASLTAGLAPVPQPVSRDNLMM